MPLGSARLQNPAQPLPEAGSWHTTCAHNHQCLPGFGDHPVAESLRGGGLVAQGQCLPSGGLLGRVPQGFPGPPTRWPTGVNTEDRRLTTAGQPLLTPTQQAVPGGVWGPATQGRTWCIARITRPGSRVQSHPPGWPAPPPPRRLPAVRTLLSRPDEAGSPSPSGVLGRATTQQGRRQSPGVARSFLNQKPPQGPPEHSGVLAPDTGAPCPQLGSGHRSPPILLLNSSLGAPPGRKHHGGECGRRREKQEPWWGLHQAASTPRQSPASWAPAAASWGLRQESWPPHGPSRILSCYTNRPEGPWMPPPSRRRAARSCKRDGGGEPCQSGGPLGWRHGAAGLGCRAATVAVAAGPHAWRTPPPVGLTPWA